MVRKIFSSIILVSAFIGVSYGVTSIDMCVTYFNAGDYQRAVEAGRLAIRQYPTNEHAYFCLGVAYTNIGQINLAIESLKKAELYAKNDVELEAIYNRLGMNYDKKGDLDNALLYYSKSLKLAEDLGDREGESKNLNNIALIFQDKGEYDKALKYYKKSLELATNEKDTAPTYNNIAFMYLYKGDYNEAIKYFKKAIGITERYGDYCKSGMIILNLGDTYRQAKDYEDAKYYLEEGLKRVKKVGDKYWEGVGYKYFGYYYLTLGNKELAIDYFKRAYRIFNSIGDFKDVNELFSIISKLIK